MTNWFTDFFSLLFPRSCVVCSDALSSHERYLCIDCLRRLPKTNYHLEKDNEIEKRFWGKFEIEKASAYFHYKKDSDFNQILYELKYRNCKEIGYTLGRNMAMGMLSSDFFKDVDLIIPIPLHKKKFKKRGYNQSEWIAKGISDITGIEVDSNSVQRIFNNSTQTRKSLFERWENVENIFVIVSPSSIKDKHVLLIDDVLTTGATISSCAQTILQIPGTKISILTLSVA